MKRGLALVAVGILALGIQGGLATLLPRGYCPDLGLLAVLAIGLQWRGMASGMGIAAVLGYSADLLSGSLLGAHALLRILLFSCAYLARRQLNLRGAAPLAVFAAGMTIFYFLGLLGLTSFFSAGEGFRWSEIGALLTQAVANALTAPLVAWGIDRLWDKLGDDAFRGGLELDSRRTAS
jgi:cell shape-determining protein MreD